MSVCRRIASALVLLDLALVGSSQNAHAQCGGGASCGSHGGGHAAGLSSAHLGGTHGGAGHAAFGGVGGANAWGGPAHQTIQRLSHATPGANTSFGLDHRSHLAAGSSIDNSVRNRCDWDGEVMSIGLRQTTLWPGRSPWASESPSTAEEHSGFHSGTVANDHGFLQASLTHQYPGHIASPESGDSVLYNESRRSPSFRTLGSAPGIRRMSELPGRNGGSLVRENILRRAYGLPARSLPSLHPLGGFSFTTPDRSAALPKLSSGLAHRFGESSVPSLLSQVDVPNPPMFNHGAFMSEKPHGDYHTTRPPPTTSAPADGDSTAKAGDEHR